MAVAKNQAVYSVTYSAGRSRNVVLGIVAEQSRGLVARYLVP